MRHFLFSKADKDFRLESFNQLSLNFLKGSCTSVDLRGHLQRQVSPLLLSALHTTNFWAAS